MKCPMRPMSWLPRNVGRLYAFESASVYRSSWRNRSRRLLVAAPSAANRLRAALEPEVEDGLELALGGVPGRECRIAGEHLPEHEEVVVAARRGMRLERRRELLPELDVDVLRGVDPEAVDAQVSTHVSKMSTIPSTTARLLREQVVQPEEVAVLRALAGERRVAAVVVQRPVVEPGRDLDGRVRGAREDGGVREADVDIQVRERVAPDVVAVVELAARRRPRRGRCPCRGRRTCPPGNRSRRRCG